MSVKVADLYAQLSLESSIDKDIDDAVDDGAKTLRKGKGKLGGAGEEAGDEISEGVGRGGNKMGGKLSSIMGKLGPALLAGGAILGAKLMGGIVSRGTELEALRGKISTVFEGSTDDIKKWADANNEAFGVSKQEMAGMAAGVADLLKPLGFSAGAAADMSKKTLDMAGALSAWTGGKVSATEATDVLNKAILGETDGLVALGVKLSGDEVTKRTQDIMKQTGATEGIAKAQAVQQLVMEKSTDAQKAWSSGAADGVKNSNALKAKLADLKDTLAEKLQPVFAKLIGFIKDTVFPWFDKLGTMAAPLFDQLVWVVTTKMVPAFMALRDALVAAIGWLLDHKEILIGVGVAILATLVPAFVAWAAGAASAAAATVVALAPVIAIGAAIAALVAGIIWAYNNWDWFREAVQKVASFLKDEVWPILQQVAEFLWNGLSAAVSFVADVWTEYLWPALQKIAGFIINTVVPAIGTLIGWLVAIGTKIGEVAMWIGARVADIVGFIVSLPGRIGSVISTLWDGLKSGITTAKDWVYDRIEDVVRFATGLPDRIANSFGGMWDGIKDAFRGALNWVIDKWNNLGFTFPTIDVPIIGKVGGWNFDTPNIPRFHTGTPPGGVPGSPGQEVPALLKAGETVRTTGQEADLQRRLGGLRGLAAMGSAAAAGGLRGASPTAQTAATSAPSVSGGGTSVQVDVSTNADPYEIGTATAWAVEHSGAA